MSEVAAIDRVELRTKIDRGDRIILLEALPPTYYEESHLPGALNMPHDQVDELAGTLLPDKDAEIVVYCANLACENSVTASRRLAQLGYRAVREYPGGKQDWIDAGLPVERRPVP
jgi:rhodanese-related sulfurtransferase